MEQLKDYLHLYLGCEVIDTNVKDKKFERYTLTAKELAYYIHRLHSLKPILRPLRDMTEEESAEWLEIENRHWPVELRFQAVKIKWLLSKHFDLFGLIEAGLAIDKTKIG